MDQRTNIVEQDIKDILETRLEISRKIQLLDNKARYELENMKTKWSDMAASVSETGKDIINQSTRVLNPGQQMTTRPWIALTGVVLLGMAIGIVKKRFGRRRVYPYYPPTAHGVPVMPSEGEKESTETEAGIYPYFPEGHQEERGRPLFSSNLWNDVKGNVRSEISRSKDALGFALGEFARGMTKEIVPTILRALLSPQSGGSRR